MTTFRIPRGVREVGGEDFHQFLRISPSPRGILHPPGGREKQIGEKG